MQGRPKEGRGHLPPVTLSRGRPIDRGGIVSFCPTNDFKDCKFYHLRCGDIDKELGDKLIGDKRLWRKQGCLLRNPFTMTLFVNSPMRRSSSLRP